MPTEYPWRNGRSVEQVIAANRQFLDSAGILEPGSGHTEQELSTWSHGLRSPPPAEAIDLFRAARPRKPGEGRWSICLFALADPDVRWHALLNERPHPVNIIWPPDEPLDRQTKRIWGKAQGFMLGGTPFFDRLFIVRGHTKIPDGSVVLTDHESTCPMPMVARSLAEFLERLCYFEGTDLISVPGEREHLPLEKALLFAQEFAELNPDAEEGWSEWAARARLKRDQPSGHLDGYQTWDRKAKRLVPLGPQVLSLQLNRPSAAEIRSLNKAIGLEYLMILGSQIADLSPLGQMPKLAHLALYDCGTLDASPLAQARTLREIFFLRCKVSGLASLATLKYLTRLRTQDCEFDAADLAAFAQARPDVRLE